MPYPYEYVSCQYTPSPRHTRRSVPFLRLSTLFRPPSCSLPCRVGALSSSPSLYSSPAFLCFFFYVTRVSTSALFAHVYAAITNDLLLRNGDKSFHAKRPIDSGRKTVTCVPLASPAGPPFYPGVAALRRGKKWVTKSTTAISRAHGRVAISGGTNPVRRRLCP